MSFDGLQRIGQIALQVGEIGEAVTFYRDTLGMRFLFEAPPQMAFFDCNGIRLMLGEPESESEPEENDGPASASSSSQNPTILYFDVPDIHAAHDALRDRGVEFVEGPRKVAELEETALWLAFFRDPWRNVLALMSEVPL